MYFIVKAKGQQSTQNNNAQMKNGLTLSDIFEYGMNSEYSIHWNELQH